MLLLMLVMTELSIPMDHVINYLWIKILDTNKYLILYVGSGVLELLFSNKYIQLQGPEWK